MDEDDLADIYRLESAKSLETEAAKRIAEVADPVRDARLRATALKDLLESDDLVPAIIARLGIVRAALEGHGGGVKVEQATADDRGVDLILNLDGACIACGAAPGPCKESRTICSLRVRFGGSASARVCWTHSMNLGASLFSSTAMSRSFERRTLSSRVSSIIGLDQFTGIQVHRSQPARRRVTGTRLDSKP